jgi:TonB family protein
MPNPARVVQATAAEIPVTVQGSKIVEGSENRELFTESAKTTLILENGAVLHLRSRVALGQSLFLRNEQTGREIVCRVVEAPREGQAGYTGLEFVAPDPEFWGVHAETAEEKAGAQEKTEASEQNPLATPSQTPATGTPSEFALKTPFREELVPAHEASPETASVSPVSPPLHESSVPTGEQIDAAIQKMAAAPQEPHEGTESSDAKDAKNLAALMAMEAKRAKRADIEQQKEARRGELGAPSLAPPEATTDGTGGTDAEVVITNPSLRERLAAALERLTTGKGLIVSEVALCLIIVVALGFIWRAVQPLFFSGSERPTVNPGQPKPKVPLSAARPTPATAPFAAAHAPLTPGAVSKIGNTNSHAEAAAPSVNAASRSVRSAAKALQPTMTKGSPIVSGSAKRSAGTSAAVDARKRSSAEAPVARAGAKSETSSTMPAPDQARTQPKDEQLNSTSTQGNLPAKIVWQVQPAFPSWAKALEVDGIVKLDAVIDENGNVTQTRVLSGPRPLQHAAQQTVGDWIFEPAHVNGKAVSSHITLTVEFQR